MRMSHMRGRIAQRCELVTRTALEELGLEVQDYGQAMLPDAARRLLRDQHTAERWKQDYIVRTTRGRLVLVDAKFSFDGTPNHSVEMRSLLTAGQSDLPTFYVFSRWQVGGTFSDFTVLHYQEVPTASPAAWPCCNDCHRIFCGSEDPMRELPERCPRQTRGTTASATPYFVVKPPFHALTAAIFDMEPWFAMTKPPCRRWDRNTHGGWDDSLTPRMTAEPGGNA